MRTTQHIKAHEPFDSMQVGPWFGSSRLTGELLPNFPLSPPVKSGGYRNLVSVNID